MTCPERLSAYTLFMVAASTEKPVEQINLVSAEIEIILVCAYKQPLA
jgi:hypothetical protein